jgi:hypothetical protein
LKNGISDNFAILFDIGQNYAPVQRFSGILLVLLSLSLMQELILMNSSNKDDFPNQARIAALALAATSALALFALMHHPMIERTSGQQDTLEQIVAFQGKDQLIHGALIAIIAILAWSLSVFGQLLGAQRPLIIAARNFYHVGCGALTTAMLFDGFILPHFAARFVNAAVRDIDVIFVVLSFLGSVIQVFSKFGFLCMSAAILCWAFVLVLSSRFPGWMRVSGALGAVMSLITAVALAFVAVRLAPASLVATFAMYIFWHLTAAAILLASARDRKLGVFKQCTER